MGGRISDPRGSGLAKSSLIVEERRKVCQSLEQTAGQPLPKATDERRFVLRCGQPTEDFKSQPANAVVICSGVREKVLCNALQPSGTQRVEAATLQGLEEAGLRLTRGPMGGVDRRIVKPSPHCQSIAEGAQT
jgi:hypothetical protein